MRGTQMVKENCQANKRLPHSEYFREYHRAAAGDQKREHITWKGKKGMGRKGTGKGKLL